MEKRAIWMVTKTEYPKCSNCEYHWITQCYGKYAKKLGDLRAARYCPNCGCKMTIKEYTIEIDKKNITEV